MLQATAPQAVGSALAGRLLADPAHRRLAIVLARAAGRGADPGRVLTDAVAFDDLTGARSPALVLASRIEDFPTALGIPRHDPTASPRQPDRRPDRVDDPGPSGRPLPWLESPEVGHPGWSGYLRQRAALIGHRADHLGSMAAAYREEYRLTHLPAGDLGDPPPAGTLRHAAYQAARDDLLLRVTYQPQRRQVAPRPGGRPPPEQERRRLPEPPGPSRRDPGDGMPMSRNL
jgi:hypothetical protein